MTPRIFKRLTVLTGALAGAATLVAAGCGGSGGANPVAAGLGGIISSSVPGGNQIVQGANVAGKGIELANVTFDAQKQREIGQSVAVGITNKYPLVSDSRLQDYVNLVGLTVASASANPELQYAFAVIDTPQVGAYSTPGGYVFVTRGALAIMKDESELAGVLAHEIAHVANNDGIESVKAAKGADFLATGLTTYQKDAQKFGNFTNTLLSEILTKPMSPGQESRADVQGARIAADAGYDPGGLSRFLQRMQSQRTSSGQVGLPTHPTNAERIAKLQSTVAGLNANGATLQERFAENVTLR